MLLGIARLGKHIVRNGEPGWIVIGRGYDDVLSALQVWQLSQ